MGGEMRLSMLLALDATRARAEAVAFRRDAEALGRAVRAAGREGAQGGAELARAITPALAPLAAGTAEADRAAVAIQRLGASGAAGGQNLLTLATAEDHAAHAAETLFAQMAAQEAAFAGQTRAALGTATALGQLVVAQHGLTEAAGLTVAEQLQIRATLDDVRAQFDPLFAASKRYEQALRDIADAERMGALSAVQAAAARDRAAQGMAPLATGLAGVGQGAAGASAYVTQLGYQFNDIGMMLAAGQSPLMLAVQQGTQVTQVFDAMRVQGMSVGAALKNAFLDLLNPMNLATMGAIAVGAFAVQALMSMGGEVKDVSEAFQDLKTSVDLFAQAAGRSVSDVVEEFGRLDEKTVSLQKNLTALARVRAQLDFNSAVGSLKSAVTPGGFGLPQYPTAYLVGGPSGDAQADMARLGRFNRSVSDLATAVGVQSQLTAVQSLKAQILSAAGGIDQMTSAQAEYFGMLLETEAVANRILVAQKEAARQDLELVRAGGINGSRPVGVYQTDPVDPAAAATKARSQAEATASARAAIADATRENELARLKLAYGEESVQVRAAEAEQARAATEAEIQRLGIALQGNEAVRMRAATEEAIALAAAQRDADAAQAAARMLTDLKSQAVIAGLSAKYGADSLEVAYARVEAERAAYAAQLEAQGITGETAADLMSAWDAAKGIAAVNMAAGIGAAADEARLLAAQLGVSLDHAIGLMGLKAKADAAPTGPKFGFGGEIGGAGDGFTGTGKPLGFGSLSEGGEVSMPEGSSSRGGRGARGDRSKRDAAAELIAKYEEQNAVLLARDPIEKELLGNSEAMAKATDAQRAKITALVAENQRLTAVQERLKQIGDLGKTAFAGLVSGATSFRGAIENVLEGLAQMAASRAWDRLWSGGASGGGLSGWVGKLLGFADGGLIPGGGGPRADDVLIRASSGEYMVNAAATAAHRPLIEAINAGASPRQLARVLASEASGLPAYADGGLIGRARSPGQSAPASWMAAQSAAQSGIQSAASGAPAAAQEVALTVSVEGARGNAEIAEMVERGIRAGIEAWSRQGLPTRLRQINADPRRMS